ncbi:MAG: uroporphyrinogen-III synthase [Gammaproteobacteria bacterium]|nr:uroporphyrinogen-III synthase [Gammaproteobacteria bacterium]MBU0788601.1 uroporphyrinogen-III synthase [Gammaproteobacteria bacterium]MBU0815575.1 uroporphyrinogen-III synthase [Gammaproteobacteria bacterium]MBU1788217.1 uroporphyrinogen-III synthase [Gammaproteobacteria bacterium]
MQLIVTRPERDAQRWVQSLAEAGRQAVALPLISVAPASDQSAVQAAWLHLADYAAVMFVSANAVSHFFASKLPLAPVFIAHSATKTRAWATGPGTMDALLKAGVPAARIDAPPKDAGQFDSETLWQLVGPRVQQGDRVLIVRGTQTAGQDDKPELSSGVGRDWLAAQLTAAGAQVDFVVAYQRGLPPFTPAQLQLAQRAATDGSVWLFSSSEAVANLRRLLPQQDWSQAMAVATHARIADAAREAGFGQVRESRPALSDILASIESPV